MQVPEPPLSAKDWIRVNHDDSLTFPTEDKNYSPGFSSPSSLSAFSLDTDSNIIEDWEMI